MQYCPRIGDGMCWQDADHSPMLNCNFDSLNITIRQDADHSPMLNCNFDSLSITIGQWALEDDVNALQIVEHSDLLEKITFTFLPTFNYFSHQGHLLWRFFGDISVSNPHTHN